MILSERSKYQYVLHKSARGRHLDPENRDFGIGIEKNGVGTGRDGFFDPDFFRDGTGWGFSIPIFSGRDGIEKKLNRDPDLVIFSSFFLLALHAAIF